MFWPHDGEPLHPPNTRPYEGLPAGEPCPYLTIETILTLRLPNLLLLQTDIDRTPTAATHTTAGIRIQTRTAMVRPRAKAGDAGHQDAA